MHLVRIPPKHLEAQVWLHRGFLCCLVRIGSEATTRKALAEDLSELRVRKLMPSGAGPNIESSSPLGKQDLSIRHRFWNDFTREVLKDPLVVAGLLKGVMATFGAIYGICP